MRAPAKTLVVPAAPALDVAPMPFPLDDPQTRAEAEAVMAEEPIHPSGILVEIEETQISCHGIYVRSMSIVGMYQGRLLWSASIG